MAKEDTDPSQKACVLVSGGIESSVLLADALNRYEAVTPVYVQNHLRWEEVEIFWLKKFLRTLKSTKLQPLKVLDLTLRDIYANHWSITGIQTPGSQSKDASVYLPGRNIIFLSKAAVFAVLNQAGAIEIGVLKGNPFSDSSKNFFKKMSAVLSQGLGQEIAIRAPFQNLKKEEVILLGKKLPLEVTFSCINPKGYDHCGDCNKCTERKKAFFGAGMTDRTSYRRMGI